MIVSLVSYFLLFRVLYRLFYLLRTGHRHRRLSWTYSPRAKMNAWLEDVLIRGKTLPDKEEKAEREKDDRLPLSHTHSHTHSHSLSPSLSPFTHSPELPWHKHEALSTHTLHSSADDTPLVYRRLGRGTSRVYLLANGVGTDLFMWLPVLQHCLSLDPALFDKISLIAPVYRGLLMDFGAETPWEKQPVDGVHVTMKLCVQDLCDVLVHAGVLTHCASTSSLPSSSSSYSGRVTGIVGWSTGAQIALHFSFAHPQCVDSLFLLNAPTEKTLHTAFQPFVPLPRPIGSQLSKIAHVSITYLQTLVPTALWPTLRALVHSRGFHVFLSLLAFFGGGPPEQPVFFHEYMRDVFKNRTHTRALLDLILALDEPLPCASLDDLAQAVTQHTVIVSGTPDFLSGVYHSRWLAQRLRRCKHVEFRTGSHFLLLEWPEELAKELVLFFNHQFD